jgi:hypothetical protein
MSAEVNISAVDNHFRGANKALLAGFVASDWQVDDSRQSGITSSASEGFGNEVPKSMHSIAFRRMPSSAIIGIVIGIGTTIPNGVG